jgi:hypothetical protein
VGNGSEKEHIFSEAPFIALMSISLPEYMSHPFKVISCKLKKRERERSFFHKMNFRWELTQLFTTV